MQDFYEVAKLCHKERKEEEYKQNKSLAHESDYQFALFSIWCRINEKQISESAFRDYLKEENDLNFWIKKHIFEKHFNYKFEFNHNTNKWKSKKISNNIV